jgi:hypothetical protein
VGNIRDAAGKSRRELLEAVRDRLADALDDNETAVKDLAPLSRRLEQVREQLDALDVAEAADPVGMASRNPDEPLDGDDPY